jgi:hypothetical protein
MRPSWPTTVVALAFIALVGVMFWRATDADNFATVWAAVGTVVGVVVGAIPSFFFKAQADIAQDRAKDAQSLAMDEARKTQLYAGAADPQLAQKIQEDHANLFQEAA